MELPPLPPDAASPNLDTAGLDTAGNESRQSLREDSPARSEPAAAIDRPATPSAKFAAPPASAASDDARREGFALDSNGPFLQATHPVSRVRRKTLNGRTRRPGVLAQDLDPTRSEGSVNRRQAPGFLIQNGFPSQQQPRGRRRSPARVTTRGDHAQAPTGAAFPVAIRRSPSRRGIAGG